MIRMVVGLGNPGKRYAATRHNIGRRVVDYLDDKDISLPPGVSLFKPDTFMNNSGSPVATTVRKKGLSPDQILVVLDDFELPLGKLRIRKSGSSGGHNGLSSVLEALGTRGIPRLRVGIGPVPDGQDPAEFVLEKFSSHEQSAVILAIAGAANAVAKATREGLDAAMNEYNNRPL